MEKKHFTINYISLEHFWLVLLKKNKFLSIEFSLSQEPV